MLSLPEGPKKLELGTCLKHRYTQRISVILNSQIKNDEIWYSIKKLDSNEVTEIPASMIENYNGTQCPPAGPIFLESPRPSEEPKIEEIVQVWEESYIPIVNMESQNTKPNNLPMNIDDINTLLLQYEIEMERLKPLLHGGNVPYKKAFVVNKARVKARKLEQNIAALTVIKKHPDKISMLKDLIQ